MLIRGRSYAEMQHTLQDGLIVVSFCLNGSTYMYFNSTAELKQISLLKKVLAYFAESNRDT